MEYTGYLVDGNGEINFSGIGKIKIGGMTKFEAERLIGEKILKTVENPVVDIRLVNYKITVMGEVASPNIYRVSNEKISIVQAIAMAGDLTLYGQRRNIQVFRVENGEKKTYTVDITSPDIFYSPAYYLQQNDIVYVSPNGTKTRSSTTLSPYISLFITSVSFIFSALAFLVYQRK
jgi:polysaccharide export outer membrane protein